MLKNKVKTSSEFRNKAIRAIVSIIFFVIIYILLLLLAVGLTIACVYAGIFIVMAVPNFITIIFGVGLASLGILILIFLLKFIFKSNSIDRSHLLEIKREDEPDLFNVIDEIANEVKTSSPKKVYLSTDVNASVFYNSNFWSMFFPVRKNLQIGLGLVNTTTELELKAILSHEFGHFSQKSMKVGSYVYNVNQVIFNLVNDDESYDKIIQSWANISGYIAIFVLLAVRIIRGIQWVLRNLYGVVNKSYLGLSREMEFHADEIAASITGFKPLKISLLRIPIADNSFNSVLGFYEGKINENLVSSNLYAEQSYVMNFLAKKNGTKIVNSFPVVTLEESNKYDKSKLVVENQWASHPSTGERIYRLEKTNFDSNDFNWRPANEIFNDIETVQKLMTNRMFKAIEYKGQVTYLTLEKFKSDYNEKFKENSFSGLYNGYYDDKNIIRFKPEEIASIEINSGIKELFSDKKVNLIYTMISLRNDIEILKQISNKTIKVKTFDYDGRKYKRKEINDIISRLNHELKEADSKVKENDLAIYKYFATIENKLGGTLRLSNLYAGLFDFDEKYDLKFEVFTKLSVALEFINVVTPFEEIKVKFLNVEELEVEFKKQIDDLLSYGMVESEMTDEIKSNFKLYLSKSWRYFSVEQYIDRNLEILFTALNNYLYLLDRAYFLFKKELLVYQEELYLNHTQQCATDNPPMVE